MLTRKMLSALGIEQDKIEQIIEGHAETVTSLRDEIDKAKEEAEKAKSDLQAFEDIKKENEALKKQVADGEKTRKDLEKMTKDFEDFKAEVEKSKVRAKKESAYTEILKDAGIPEKHFAKILKYSDVDGIELDEGGKATNAKELLKAVKEEWSDHIPTVQVKGADLPTPPSGGQVKKTKSEIMAIKDARERQKAIAENMEAFRQ